MSISKYGAVPRQNLKLFLTDLYNPGLEPAPKAPENPPFHYWMPPVPTKSVEENPKNSATKDQKKKYKKDGALSKRRRRRKPVSNKKKSSLSNLNLERRSKYPTQILMFPPAPPVAPVDNTTKTLLPEPIPSSLAALISRQKEDEEAGILSSSTHTTPISHARQLSLISDSNPSPGIATDRNNLQRINHADSSLSLAPAPPNASSSTAAYSSPPARHHAVEKPRLTGSQSARQYRSSSPRTFSNQYTCSLTPNTSLISVSTAATATGRRAASLTNDRQVAHFVPKESFILRKFPDQILSPKTLKSSFPSTAVVTAVDTYILPSKHSKALIKPLHRDAEFKQQTYIPKSEFLYQKLPGSDLLDMAFQPLPAPKPSPYRKIRPPSERDRIGNQGGRDQRNRRNRPDRRGRRDRPAGRVMFAADDDSSNDEEGITEGENGMDKDKRYHKQLGFFKPNTRRVRGARTMEYRLEYKQQARYRRRTVMAEYLLQGAGLSKRHLDRLWNVYRFVHKVKANRSTVTRMHTANLWRAEYHEKKAKEQEAAKADEFLSSSSSEEEDDEESDWMRSSDDEERRAEEENDRSALKARRKSVKEKAIKEAKQVKEEQWLKKLKIKKRKQEERKKAKAFGQEMIDNNHYYKSRHLLDPDVQLAIDIVKSLHPEYSSRWDRDYFYVQRCRQVTDRNAIRLKVLDSLEKSGELYLTSETLHEKDLEMERYELPHPSYQDVRVDKARRRTLAFGVTSRQATRMLNMFKANFIDAELQVIEIQGEPNFAVEISSVHKKNFGTIVNFVSQVTQISQQMAEWKLTHLPQLVFTRLYHHQACELSQRLIDLNVGAKALPIPRPQLARAEWTLLNGERPKNGLFAVDLVSVGTLNKRTVAAVHAILTHKEHTVARRSIRHIRIPIEGEATVRDDICKESQKEGVVDERALRTVERLNAAEQTRLVQGVLNEKEMSERKNNPSSHYVLTPGVGTTITWNNGNAQFRTELDFLEFNKEIAAQKELEEKAEVESKLKEHQYLYALVQDGEQNKQRYHEQPTENANHDVHPGEGESEGEAGKVVFDWPPRDKGSGSDEDNGLWSFEEPFSWSRHLQLFPPSQEEGEQEGDEHRVQTVDRLKTFTDCDDAFTQSDEPPRISAKQWAKMRKMQEGYWEKVLREKSDLEEEVAKLRAENNAYRMQEELNQKYRAQSSVSLHAPTSSSRSPSKSSSSSILLPRASISSSK